MEDLEYKQSVIDNMRYCLEERQKMIESLISDVSIFRGIIYYIHTVLSSEELLTPSKKQDIVNKIAGVIQ